MASMLKAHGKLKDGFRRLITVNENGERSKKAEEELTKKKCLRK